MALLGTADVERPLDPEEAALVVEAMHLRLVDKDAGLTVTDEGVVVPGIPQALDRIDIILGDLVAQFVLGMFAAVIAPRAFERRGYRIPSCPAAADEIDRGELAGNGEGIAIRGRDRADEADLRGRGGERRENGDRLKPVEEMRDGLLVDVEPVGNEGESDA